MADIPKGNNDTMFNNTMRENVTNFSEIDFKNVTYNIKVKNDSEQDLYKDGVSGLFIETGTIDAANKLNKSNNDIVGGLTNVNSTLNEEMRIDTHLNTSVWNIYRVSFEKVIFTYIEI